MAKKIKAIKCPSCGSVKITELKSDYYKCNSCGTEFFLDSDDININYNYNRPQNSVTARKIAVFGAVGFLLLFIVPRIIRGIFSSKARHDTRVESRYTEPSPMNEEKNYFWANALCQLQLKNDGTPYLAIVGQIKDRKSGDTAEDTVYAGLYDAATLKKKWVKEMSGVQVSTGDDFRMQALDDNHLYIIVKHRHVYRIHPDSAAIADIQEQYEKGNPALNIGIARIDFMGKKYGSVYKLVTNDGRTLFFLPLINQVYTESAFNTAMAQELPQPLIKTGYNFNGVHENTPNEKRVLIKYTYSYQYGYPRADPLFSLQRDTKISISDRSAKDSRLLSYKDLTPGRNYFQPVMLAFNDSLVMIGNKPTSAEDERYQIQLLNANTGAIVKTFDTDLEKLFSEGAILKNGYVISSDKYYFFDVNGKQVTSSKGGFSLEVKEPK